MRVQGPPRRPGRRLLARSAPCALLVLLLLAAGASATPRALDLHTLEESEPLAQAASLTFVTFFQPACDWCRRQLEALEKHTSRCEAARVIAVGLWGSIGALRREVAGFALPAYRANPALLAAFDAEVRATPLTLVAGPQRETLLTLRGYADGEKLRRIATAVLGDGACDRRP